MTKEEILRKERKDLQRSDHKCILSAMDEYAKQQAIAFFRFCLPGPSDFEPHISNRYDLFIEQQNKDNGHTGNSSTTA